MSLGDDIADASELDLFFAARGDALPGGSGESTPDGSRTDTRAELLKRFALRSADGVCQGCGEEVGFVDVHGDPFLEIHHLHRRIDGGPNSPENVIALCPDCHRRRHRSSDGDAFNRELIETAERRNERLRDAVDHEITE